eukprot:2884510-Amphidinium_carterae.2
MQAVRSLRSSSAQYSDAQFTKVLAMISYDIKFAFSYVNVGVWEACQNSLSLQDPMFSFLLPRA